MPTISEIRDKYPQYKDLSDQALADALHSKFYSDMPKEDFYAKVGFDVPQEKIDKPSSSFADKAVNVVEALGIPTDPNWGKNLVQSASQGVGEAGMNLANKIASLVGGPKPGNIPEFQAKNAPMQGVAEGAKELAPALIPFYGQEALGAKLTGMAAKALPKALSGASGVIGRAAARAPYGAGFGAVSELASKENVTKEDLKHSASIGAALNTVIPGLLDAFPGAYKSVIKLYKNAAERDKNITGSGVRSPEQVKELMNDIGADVLSFPDAVRSPKLQSFYHSILKWMPFSGIPKAQQAAIGRLEKDAGDIYSSVLGNSNEADEVLAREGIAGDVRGYVDSIKGQMKPKYEALDADAAARNLKVSKESAMKFASDKVLEHIKSIESGFLGTLSESALTDLAKILRVPGKKYKELFRIKANGTDITDSLPDDVIESLRKSQPKQLTEEAAMSLPVMRSTLSQLRDKADNFLSKDQRKESALYNKLAKLFEDDIATSLQKSGNEDLFIRNKELAQEYKEKLVHFLHSEENGMRNIVNDNIDYNSGAFENVFKNTKNEAAIKQLPQDTKNKIFSRLLTQNVDEKLNTRAEKIAGAYKKLNDYEKGFLDKDTKAKFDDLSKRAEQLKPILGKSAMTWHTFYKLKYLSYMAGIPFYSFVGALPTAVVTGALSVPAKFLGNRDLIAAYMGGKIPKENWPKVGSKLAKIITAKSGGEKQ